MAVIRISGVAIEQNNKHIHIALRSIYGVGPSLSKKICKISGVDESSAVKILTEANIESIRETINKLTTEGHLFEGDLSRAVKLSIKRLMDMGCYRGRRHRMRLPARGQNTKNNAKTRKRSRRSK
jgi:small subunit ribosomal protein S13